jgi:fluoride exporter
VERALPNTEQEIVDRHVLHRSPAAAALVLIGGTFGAAAREAVEQAIHPAGSGFPTATFLINMAGALCLGTLLEALVRSGRDVGWRRHARLLGGTGFCGAFTTYSTFAVETVQLFRADHPGIAVIYVAATILGGLVATTTGIAAAAGFQRRHQDQLPIDPDVDREPTP